MKLLSVDWDFWFPTNPNNPNCFDWSASESISPALSAIVWHSRAAGFYESGQSLPRMEDGWKSFFDRVSLTAGAKVCVADSHALIWPLLRRALPSEVVNLDAHHDAFDDVLETLARGVDCANWASAAKAIGVPVTWVKPAWVRGWRGSMKAPLRVAHDIPEETFDMLFVCRSGAWTPPWCDDDFEAFLATIPGQVEMLQDVVKRPFSENQCLMMAEQSRAAREFFEKQINGEV